MRCRDSPVSTRIRAGALLFLSSAIFYGVIARGMLVFGDDVLMFQVTTALFERGSVRVSAAADTHEPTRAVAGQDGERYSKYGIGLSIAALPFYGIGRAFEGAGFRLPETVDPGGNLRTGTRVLAVSLTNAWIGAATVVALYLLAGTVGFSTWAATGTAFAFGFATVFAHSTTTFLSEPLSALALTSGLWAAAEAFRRGKRAPVSSRLGLPGSCLLLAISGFAAGSAVATRLANLVPVVPLVALAAVAALRQRDSKARFLGLAAWWMPFLAWSVLVGVYNVTRFASLFESGYGAEASAFSTPLWKGLLGLLVSPGRGVIWYSPAILLGALGLRALLRRQPAIALTAGAMSAGSIVLAAKFYQWHGGGVWGPRLIVPILPLLMLPAGEIFERIRAGRGPDGGRRGPILATLICVSAGFFTVALAVLVPFDRSASSVWRPPIDLESVEIRDSLWRPGASPLAIHARALPRAIVRTARLVAGTEGMPAASAKGEPGLPDLAFARYGSHGLLQIFRIGLLALVVAAGALIHAAAAPLSARKRGS